MTKDYPGEPSSGLDVLGAFRVNVSTTPETFAEHAGRTPRDPEPEDYDPSITDTVIAHPVYASMAWLAVVDPGERTADTLRELLVEAHARAVRAWERRAERAGDSA